MSNIEPLRCPLCKGDNIDGFKHRTGPAAGDEAGRCRTCVIIWFRAARGDLMLGNYTGRLDK